MIRYGILITLLFNWVQIHYTADRRHFELSIYPFHFLNFMLLSRRENENQREINKARKLIKKIFFIVMKNFAGHYTQKMNYNNFTFKIWIFFQCILDQIINVFRVRYMDLTLNTSDNRLRFSSLKTSIATD